MFKASFRNSSTSHVAEERGAFGDGHSLRDSSLKRVSIAVTAEEDFDGVTAAFERQNIRFCLKLELLSRRSLA